MLHLSPNVLFQFFFSNSSLTFFLKKNMAPSFESKRNHVQIEQSSTPRSLSNKLSSLILHFLLTPLTRIGIMIMTMILQYNFYGARDLNLKGSFFFFPIHLLDNSNFSLENGPYGISSMYTFNSLRFKNVFEKPTQVYEILDNHIRNM